MTFHRREDAGNPDVPICYEARGCAVAGCGHEIGVTLQLTESQLATIGVAYLAGTAKPAQQMIEIIFTGMQEMATSVRCPACQERVVN